MDYRLIVLTHDGDASTSMLLDTLSSFRELVTPEPAEIVLVEDGPPKEALPSLPVTRASTGTDGPHGFCAASSLAWEIAAAPGVDWVYWLEHDFIHVRPVHLRDLAAVLLLEDQVAQMSLMRQPVNKAEEKAGGLFWTRPDGFVPRRTQREKYTPLKWLEQGIYWTTNPSLFRADIAREHPFPDGPECEGKLTIALRSLGYSFGVWGRGEEWVRHEGQRTGFGY